MAPYPVTGPVDVISDSPAGVRDADLGSANLRASDLPHLHSCNIEATAVALAHASKWLVSAIGRKRTA